MTTFTTIHPYTGGERIDENEIRAAADALRRSFSGQGELSDEERFAAQAVLDALVRMLDINAHNIRNSFQISVLAILKGIPPRPAPAPHWVHDGRGGHLAA